MQARFKALNVFIEANPGYAYASAGGFGAAIALAHWSLTADSRRRKKEAEEETRRVEAERHRQMMRAAAEMDRNINTWLKEMKLRNGFRDMEEKLRLLHSTYEEQNQRLEGLLYKLIFHQIIKFHGKRGARL
ncbi:hypothetical protein DFH06DRAFT_1331495 [Mycena polygramma]|nr:hypothetical protein DFH06DRAFT_1331495 [Mycena polygramma]